MDATADAAGNAARSGWHTAVRSVPPASFAFVMASGIVSSALAAAGYPSASVVLGWAAVLGFVALCVIGVAHLIRHRDMVADDIRDPQRAFGYFTIVAALNVIGARSFSSHAPLVTIVLFAISVPFWALFAYGLPANLMLRPPEKPVSSNIDGSWFLWVVGTQSLAVVAALLCTAGGAWLAPIAVSLWGIGVVLYILLAALILLRLLTVPNSPDSFTPSYWIFTGATAISVFAGSRLLELPHSLPVIADARAFIAGAAFVLWAFGTWWVPLLVIFGIWRHVIKRRPLRYETGLWSIVFPIGMYSVASMSLGTSVSIPFLIVLGRIVAIVAVVAWAATALGMLFDFVSYFRRVMRGATVSDSDAR